MSITEHLAQAILATQSDAILVADRDNVIRFWNPGAVRIFGFTKDEALGRSLDIIIPETLRARHQEGAASRVKYDIAFSAISDICRMDC